MSLLARIVDHPLARKAADSGFLQAAHRRVAALDRMNVAAVQERTLRGLLRRAALTQFGKDHGFASIRSVSEYQRRVPLRNYDDFWTEYWKDHYPNLAGQTWPDFVPYYALSSGTTTGTTKYIPVTRDMVRSNNKAAFTNLALYRHHFPKAKLFAGKFFFLGGSTEFRKQADGSLAGDLSGIAANEVADFMRPYAFPPLDLSLIADWEVKIIKLVEQSIHERITALSGVPSWMLLLIDRVKAATGKSRIIDVWPDLRLVIHGGTKFEPYRQRFAQELDDVATTIETYPCSEGFIATEDPRSKLLRIVPDHGLFYEFVPLEEFGQENPTRHTLANVEIGVQYVIILTTCAGLWSYIVGDTIVFESKEPPLIRFTGRTKYYLSAFGEHLISEEVEKALSRAVDACDVQIVEHHVGPIFPTSSDKPGHHRYFVETSTPLNDVEKFTQILDRELCKLNEDYDAHRAGDLTMLAPEVIVMPPGSFNDWMKSKGKLGGQHKVPRMDNEGKITQELTDYLARKS